jgi:hypothetical protein
MNNASTHSSSRSQIAAPPADVDARVEAVLGLYRTHFTNLVRLATLLVEDRDGAIEIEAFVHQLRARNPDAGDVATIGVVRRAVVALARERAAAAVTRPKSMPVPGEAGRRPGLLEALHELPHAQREALVLQHYGALSDDDVAAAVGASFEVVVATGAAGLRALDSMLTPGGHP